MTDSFDIPLIEVIFVDDGAAAAARDRVADHAANRRNFSIVSLPENQGAGIARNEGFTKVRGQFCIFLDVDDRVDPDALFETVKLLSTSTADFAFATYQQALSHTPDVLTGMWSQDILIWKEVFGHENRLARTVNHSHLSGLLNFTNYPWNKVFRTSFLQRIPGPLFGTQRIHNDALGHWKTLLHADQVLLVNQSFVTHLRFPRGTSLTTQAGKERIAAVVSSLDEIAAFVIANSDSGVDFPTEVPFWRFVRTIANNSMKYLPEASDQDRLRQDIRALIHRWVSPETVFQLRRSDRVLTNWLALR